MCNFHWLVGHHSPVFCPSHFLWICFDHRKQIMIRFQNIHAIQVVQPKMKFQICCYFSSIEMADPKMFMASPRSKIYGREFSFGCQFILNLIKRFSSAIRICISCGNIVAGQSKPFVFKICDWVFGWHRGSVGIWIWISATWVSERCCSRWAICRVLCDRVPHASVRVCRKNWISSCPPPDYIIFVRCGSL